MVRNSSRFPNSSRRSLDKRVQLAIRALGEEILEERLPFNAAPVANDDAYVMNQNTTLKVTDVAAVPPGGAYPGLLETSSFALDFTPDQIEYSATYQLLILREDGSEIHILDANSGAEISSQSALELFTDMDLTTDGKYLYVADFGGEVIGYDIPANPNWVHRFDLSTRIWEIKEAPTIAYRIEAVDADRFLLLSADQWVDLTLNAFAAGTDEPVVELSRLFADYHGDIEFDSATGQIYHGNAGSSSREIHLYGIIDNQLIYRDETGTYGSAQQGGYGATLSTNGEYFYYGRLQVVAESITYNVRSLPESIIASTTGVAFGKNAFYSERTGMELGTLPKAASAIGVSDSSPEIWLASTNLVQRFRVPSYGAGVLANDSDGDGDLLLATIEQSPLHGSLTLASNGGFIYTPNAGFAGQDSFSYRASDGTSISDVATVVITVDQTRVDYRPPQAEDDRYTTSTNVPLNLDDPSDYDLSSGTLFPGLRKLQTIFLERHVSQLEYSEQYHLLFVRERTNRVRVFDALTQAELDVHLPIERFTDFDLTADGRYLYIADYGGENTGLSEPTRPHWVHRFDAATRSWQVKQAPWIAYQIEAIDDDRFLLAEGDQWIEVLLNSFRADPAMPITELARTDFSYEGTMEFDHRRDLVFHGTEGLSSNEIISVLVGGNQLLQGLETDVYDSELDELRSVSLSTDGSYLFYGRLQVDPANIKTNQFLYPEPILASTGELAFGSTKIFDPRTGQAVALTPFTSAVYDAASDGRSIWAYDASTSLLHLYAIGLYGRGVLTNDFDAPGELLTVAESTLPRHGTLKLDSDGTFIYTPDEGFSGVDWFTYKVTDASFTSDAKQVAIGVSDTAPIATGETYQILSGQDLTTTTSTGILANDSDADGDELIAQLVGGPAHGVLSLNPDGSFSYLADPGFQGLDSFTYRVTDRYLSTSVVTATIQNDSPIDNSVPDPQKTVVNAPIVFSAANANAIIVVEADSVDWVRVQLQVDQGVLYLATVVGLWLDQGNGTSNIEIVGNLTNVNVALDGLRFVAPTGFIGTATLQVTSGDLASNGAYVTAADTLTIETYEAPFHNILEPADINGDGSVEPHDALLLIDDMHRNGLRSLYLPTLQSAATAAPELFLDVNADNELTPHDLLLVIDTINRRSFSVASGLLSQTTATSELPLSDTAVGIALTQLDNSKAENASKGVVSMRSKFADSTCDPIDLSQLEILADSIETCLRHLSSQLAHARSSVVDRLLVGWQLSEKIDLELDCLLDIASP
jgi:hypothetical protein